MPDNDKDNPKALVGIDLGTTFSVIARWDGRQAEPMATWASGDETQSVIYCRDGVVSVGESAYDRGLMDPDNMVLGIKRKMGDGKQQITIGGRVFTPIELSAEILRHMYNDQKKRIPPFQPRGMVVTVPYYFKEPERRNTQAAAELAGFKCMGILEEPIAGSLAYAVKRALKEPTARRTEKILVFDLGGGTFDLTLFQLEQDRTRLRFEVLASSGDNFLGGMDFDEAMISSIAAECDLNLEGLSEKLQRRARTKLLPVAKKTKERLSTEVDWPITLADAVPGQIIDMSVTRKDFEKIIGRYISRIEQITDELWRLANVDPKSVDRVIRIGGSSRIPYMSAMLDRMVGKDKEGKSKVWGDIDASLCVAEGAAIYAAYLEDVDKRKDKAYHSTFGLDIEIVTRTSHALGIEVPGGKFYTMIHRNSKTPVEKRQPFRVARDYATSLDVNVYQGTAEYVKDNQCIAKIHVPDLPARPKGEVTIFITFKVDAKNTAHVKVEADGRTTSEVIEYT